MLYSNIFLVLFLFFRFCIAGDDYKIILDRIEMDYDKNYFSADYQLFRVNRTVKALNLTLNILVDIQASDNFFVQVQAYEFLNNEYKPFALKFREKICEVVGTYYKTFLADDLPDYVPPKCPIKKGMYYIRNYIPKGSKFANFPFKKLKLEIKMFYSRQQILEMNVFSRFDRDAMYREQYN